MFIGIQLNGMKRSFGVVVFDDPEVFAHTALVAVVTQANSILHLVPREGAGISNSQTNDSDKQQRINLSFCEFQGEKSN